VIVRVLTVLKHIGIAVVFREGHDGDAAAWVIVDSDIKAALTAEDEVRAIGGTAAGSGGRCLSPLRRKKMVNAGW
jgi:hypothetical protein